MGLPGASVASGSVRDLASREESDRAPSSGLPVNTHLYHAQLIESRW